MTDERTVARPVANLGNTCYMNAVLQALAHAPELCLSMDCHPHSSHCPIAAENALKQDKQQLQRKKKKSPSPEDPLRLQEQPPPPPQGTRKSLRHGGRKSPSDNNNDAAALAETNSNSSSETELQFCALCEVERHIRQVHKNNTNENTATAGANNSNSNNSNTDKPVAPTTFVHGFIEHVAPWFQLGVQEDSHEFLRLLIDAMQKSCVPARNNNNSKENPQGACSAGGGGPEDEDDDEDTMDEQTDQEYPFQLFRGTVESNVVCAHCKATSSTLDPIEDVGLEVTVPAARNNKAASGRSSSRNPSPAPVCLASVETAFKRFIETENLDSGYKCEKCGKFGRATKQSRLARIPPILTLHLKRFRYGDRVLSAHQPAARRSARTNEVNQLMGDYSNGGGGDGGGAATTSSFSGKSGSAKIEGHIKFETVINIRPYLTDELQKTHRQMLCRLFAVIVHSGKNSHSGHYIAFVRNISKNEWWKMDDSRVTLVSEHEVKQAEAYMLFYRVVHHQVQKQLEELHQQQQRAAAANNPKKRPAGGGISSQDWARKANFPPHLLGLIDKVSEMMADEFPLTAAVVQEIQKEASSAVNNETTTGPRKQMTDADVVGGTEKYKSVLMEIFYRLKDDPSTAPWMTSIGGGGAVDNKSNEKPRVSVEEPEEPTLL